MLACPPLGFRRLTRISLAMACRIRLIGWHCGRAMRPLGLGRMIKNLTGSQLPISGAAIAAGADALCADALLLTLLLMSP
jgi:hypothetical protein